MPVSFGREQRSAILHERAAEYVRIALNNVTREYPHMPSFVATGQESYATHRELHPAFYGSFDWHSCIEMHWTAVRLLRLFPDDVPGEGVRATLNDLLTPANIALEIRFFTNENHGGLKRPYGWGWLLTLYHELATWDDPDGGRWAEAVAPLADVLAAKIVAWLPKLTYPVRTGVHPNSAFGLSRSLDHAQLRAEQGDDALLSAITGAVNRWFLDDSDYPAHYEPSGNDFLSAALCEAELVSRITAPTALPAWLERFLPGLAESQPVSLFQPATVADRADGHIAHLEGLNLSRAWAFTALADRLPDGDTRIQPLLDAAERHAEASLPHVTGSDYMVEHWLAAYATLLLS